MSGSMMVGLAASALFLVRLLPQPVRLARTGVAAGVSPMAALNGVTSAAAWTAYGLGADLPVVTGVSALALIPSTWTAVLLVQSTRRMDWVGAAAYSGTVVAAAAVGRLGVVLAGSVLLTIGPQVVVALTGSDLRGIAPATMWIALCDASTWGLYGITLGDAALVGYGAVLLSSAAVILLRVDVDQRRRQIRHTPNPHEAVQVALR